MKSVGTLREFTHGYSLVSSGSPASCYVYRRIDPCNKSDSFDVTGVLWPLQGAETAPQCLVYRPDAEVNSLIRAVTETEPDYEAVSDDNKIQYQFWCVTRAESLQALQNRLDQLPAFYSLESWVLPQSQPPQDKGCVDTLVLLLASDQLKPLPCHRLLADLGSMDDYEFLQRLQKSFNIRVASGSADATPRAAREFGLYVAGYWYHLRLIEGTWFHADPVSDLDVSVVHDNMFAPTLGIIDRHDKRIAYTDASCSLQTLQQQVDSGLWQAVWLMPAPDVEQLMNISDLGRAMPENSVCFQSAFDPAVFARAVR